MGGPVRLLSQTRPIPRSPDGDNKSPKEYSKDLLVPKHSDVLEVGQAATSQDIVGNLGDRGSEAGFWLIQHFQFFSRWLSFSSNVMAEALKQRKKN